MSEKTLEILCRPKAEREELENKASLFFEYYGLKGVNKVIVQPSIDKLTNGIMICPEKGSTIQEVYRKNDKAGQLSKSGKDYVVVDIRDVCYLVDYIYRESHFIE